MNESVGPGREMRGHKKEENMKYRNNDYSRGLTVPMNLQFFADGSAGGGGESGNAAGGEGIQPGSGDGGSETREPEGEGSRAAGGAVSFDDFLKDPKNQAEFDRRVGKALETSKGKMQKEIDARIEAARTEAEKLARMNSDQKMQYEKEKREKELADREASITRRELTATAKEQLAEKGLPVSLADVLDYSSAETCIASIDAVGRAFQEAVEKAVESRLAGGKPPRKADDRAAYTMDQIRAMSADEINKNWDAVQAAMKAGK